MKKIITNILFFAGIIGLFSITVIPFLHRVIAVLSYPHAIDVMEGVVLEGARTIANKNTVYPEFSSYPYVPVIYPPLFHIFTASILRYTGLKLFAPRIISVISTLVTAAVMFLIIKHKSKRTLYAYIFPFLFIASPTVFNWAPYSRIDWLAMAFTLTGFYGFLRLNNNSGYIFAVICFLLAIYTKQSFFLPIATLSTYVFLQKKYKKSILLFFIFWIVFIIIFLLFQYYTKGMFYTQVYTTMSGIPSKLSLSLVRWKRFLSFYWLEVFLGLTIALIYMFKRKTQNIFAIAVLLAIPVALYSLGRSGAEDNYFTELITYLYILLGISIADMISAKKNLHRYIGVFLILSILFHHGIMFAKNHFHDSSVTLFKSKLPDRNLKDSIQKIVDSTPGNAIVDAEINYLTVANKPVLVDPLNTNAMIRQKLWQYKNSKLEHDIKSSSIPLVIQAQRFLSPQILSDILHTYHLIGSKGIYSIYKPSNRYTNNSQLQSTLSLLKFIDDSAFPPANLVVQFGELKNWMLTPFEITSSISVDTGGYSVFTDQDTGHITWFIPTSLQQTIVQAKLWLTDTRYETGLYISNNNKDWIGHPLPEKGVHYVQLLLPQDWNQTYIQWRAEKIPNAEISITHGAAGIMSLELISYSSQNPLTKQNITQYTKQLIEKQIINQDVYEITKSLQQALTVADTELSIYGKELHFPIDIDEIKYTLLDLMPIYQNIIYTYGTAEEIRHFDEAINWDLVETLNEKYQQIKQKETHMTL